MHLLLLVGLIIATPSSTASAPPPRPLVDAYWIPADARAKVPAGWAALLVDRTSCGDGPIYAWDPKVVDVALGDRIFLYEGPVFWVPKEPAPTPSFQAALDAEVARLRGAAAAWTMPPPHPALKPFFEAAHTFERAVTEKAEHASRAWTTSDTAPLLSPVAGVDVSSCAGLVASLPAASDAASWWQMLQYGGPRGPDRRAPDSWFNCLNREIRRTLRDPADLGEAAMEAAGARLVGQGEGGGC